MTADDVRDDGGEASSSREGLPCGVQFVATAVFISLWLAVAFVPRLWGQDFFYEHFYWIGAGLGLLSWPLVDHFGPRFAASVDEPNSTPVESSGETVENPNDDDARVAARVRRAGWRYTLRRASAWFIVPLTVLIFVGGHSAADRDQRLIDTQPHHLATVVDVDSSPFAGRRPKVTVDLGDRTVRLALYSDGDDPVPGKQVEVVIDPEDPEHVISANSHTSGVYSWWAEALIVLAIGVLGGGLWCIWALSTPAVRAIKAARRARSVQVAHVTAFVDARVELRDSIGRTWVWTAEEKWTGSSTNAVRVVGDLDETTWPVLAIGRKLHWPGGPTSRLTGD